MISLGIPPRDLRNRASHSIASQAVSRSPLVNTTIDLRLIDYSCKGEYSTVSRKANDKACDKNPRAHLLVVVCLSFEPIKRRRFDRLIEA